MNFKSSNRLILFVLFILLLFNITSLSAQSNTKVKDNNKSTDENNYPDIAKYASFINTLFATDDNLAGFWWDCSDIVFRKDLKAQNEVIQSIMNCYKNKERYHKKSKTYVEEDAHTAVKNMNAGWNLGNTLDSTSYAAKWDSNKKQWYDNWASAKEDEKGWMFRWNDGITTWETGWGQPKTTNEIIAYVKKLGFDSVRIPITWAEHITVDGTIDPIWMARVKECVDYVIKNDMYCILNVHHDGGSNGWIKAGESSWNQYNKRFEKIWTQIATEFRNYDERLLFESMNEVLDEQSTWAPDATVAKKANPYINKWNQLFVDTVRATGANNKTRNLVVMTYAGDGSSNVFDNGFKLPKDTTADHLIIEVHNYSPQAFTSTDATWIKMTAKWDEKNHGSVLKSEIGLLSRKAKEYGAPVIIGEYAAFPKFYSQYD